MCFGRRTVLTNDQMKELASGLEKRGVHFIWSVKQPTKEHVDGGYGKTPSGFGRGLIVRGWVPQLVMLNHRAVGAFFTHCGWNSAVEGLVAGVPMLTWPMGAADQYVDAGLLVDDLKVGKRVCEGAKTVPNSQELARVLAESISENLAQRERAKQLSRAALDSIKNDGSSGKEFEALVHHLAGLQVEAR